MEEWVAYNEISLIRQFPPEAFGENNGRFLEIEYLVRKNYHDIFNMRRFQRFKENYAIYDEMAIRRKIMQARKKAEEPVVQE